MDTLRAIYTKRNTPVSLLIRCANPVSITRIAPVSHVIAVDGDTGYGIEANMLHGVRRAPLSELLSGATIVADISYQVLEARPGLIWMRETADRHAEYDFKGALGLGLSPTRDWQEDTDWFCFEFFANAMAKSGRKAFLNNARVSGYMLMSLNPFMCGYPVAVK